MHIVVNPSHTLEVVYEGVVHAYRRTHPSCWTLSLHDLVLYAA